MFVICSLRILICVSMTLYHTSLRVKCRRYSASVNVMFFSVLVADMVNSRHELCCIFIGYTAMPCCFRPCSRDCRVSTILFSQCYMTVLAHYSVKPLYKRMHAACFWEMLFNIFPVKTGILSSVVLVILMMISTILMHKCIISQRKLKMAKMIFKLQNCKTMFFKCSWCYPSS